MPLSGGEIPPAVIHNRASVMRGAVAGPFIPSVCPSAGKPAPKEMLIDVNRLEREYFERLPDLTDAHQMVEFGTSGHRGSSRAGTFTEAHIPAITQAIGDHCDATACLRVRLRSEPRPSVSGLRGKWGRIYEMVY